MTSPGSRSHPVHPGEILKDDFLVPANLSAHALAMALHVPATRIGEIINQRRGISPDTALRLARYFGGDAQSWLNLQLAYDLKVAQQKTGHRIEAEVRPMVQLA